MKPQAIETVEAREIRRREAIEERVAIMVIDGEVDEERAKYMALDCILEEFEREGKGEMSIMQRYQDAGARY